MAATPETKIKDRVKDLIADAAIARGFHYRLDWHAGNIYMSTVDATGVIAGYPVALEIKRFDKHSAPTDRQRMLLAEYERAGAYSQLIDSEAALHAFRAWLYKIAPRSC